MTTNYIYLRLFDELVGQLQEESNQLKPSRSLNASSGILIKHVLVD